MVDFLVQLEIAQGNQQLDNYNLDDWDSTQTLLTLVFQVVWPKIKIRDFALHFKGRDQVILEHENMTQLQAAKFRWSDK